VYQRIPVAVAAAFIITGCHSSTAPQLPAPPDTTAKTYDVTVTRTALGIPHIQGSDFGSVGYGYGYAFAEDNLCVMQEDFVTIRGQRAKYMGPDGSYTIEPNGVTADNITSDFYWTWTATDAAIAPARANTLPEYKKVIGGFVAGYNRYIRELKAGSHPGRHAACATQPWLFEINEDDLYRRFLRLALIASSSVFINEIVNAAPPPLLKSAAPEPTAAEKRDALLRDPGPFRFFLDHGRFGSNMYALGKDATQDGQSMVFGNPHFPWTGTERLYISHVTLPGKLDIMGASLYGVPAILIGFTDHFAWSHTVSTAYRFTIYELTLDPTDPTHYLYNGVSTSMQSQDVVIDVRNADGTLSQQHKTMYRSKFGPVFVLSASGVPVLGWTPLKAYTLRDANAENDRLINQFAKWNQATSLDEFIALHKSVLGIPWVNTVASGPNGKAYYGDVSVVPHVTDDQISTCAAHPIHDVLQQLVPGLPVLDGTRIGCEWGSDIDAPAPGIFGASHLPTMERDDWVHNCNDSYWLTNPSAPITGYNSIIGAENTARSLRTRNCILQVQRRLDGSDGRPGTKFTQALLEDVALSSHIYSAELARGDVVGNICTLGTVLTTGGPVDVSQACAVLANWDLSANLDSVGDHIWREFWRKSLGSGLPVVGYPAGFWLTPFSPSDPVNTPRDLNWLLPTVQASLGDAVSAIEAAQQPFDRPLGEIQHSGAQPELRIPIFGGEDSEGAFTVVDGTNAIDADGYRVPYGNSYIQAVTWVPDGAGFKPQADGFITYSESTDPANPHYADYTREYSAKHWHRFPFRPAEVAAEKVSEMHLAE
jgi:acyl-homoserine-lactone acylase